MDPQTHEKNEKRLIRWLLTATIVLLLLVLALQLRQALGGRHGGDSRPLTQDASGSGDSQPAAPAVSPGKAAMVEDVRALNPALSAEALSALSAGELEQLCEAGAPGLPIGRSAAAHAAEAYAGTLEMDSVTWDAEAELDDSPAHYDVELRHITLGEFDYKVDAYTGEILEGRAGVFQNVPSSSGAPEESAAGGSGTAGETGGDAPSPAGAESDAPPPTGEEAAKAAAYAHAGISEAQAEQVRCKSDWDDGIRIYEIEFRSGGTEYAYKIDASSGTVLEAELERGAAGAPGGFIGEEAAKAAALAHAGVSEAEAGFVKWELEEDDGLWVYEIEFRAGGVEYEYEIAAGDGGILKAEQDR